MPTRAELICKARAMIDALGDTGAAMRFIPYEGTEWLAVETEGQVTLLRGNEQRTFTLQDIMASKLHQDVRPPELLPVPWTVFGDV